ncbi:MULTISPECIES: S41 family peptidase [Rhizobium]|uniref:Carboxyl-terminal processing protease n=1 Tax=Rhizobium tropici TaxID=398 RepID=A0A6P1CGY6_RHITR|nr:MULTISPECIES: S41 family peptidase [Rhizobium]AGB72714.1 putative peptidase S41 [Rhizobium tropici CIAT 899]MBB4241007.1 carboxyl-terminal processing protease [Rhizobium tropici]MBB5592446.1 carboxyl-terminal processing protease [Rhizobium tropici]MBB6491332.1 carboxyl-terminal processing protease [Rhizobium tropici]NEV14064.1 peptidase S41 [Rhizobium tropici]
MTHFQDPDITDRAYIGATAYHAIKRYFAHTEGLPAGYDFEARYRAYLGEALEAPNRKAFSLATMRFFASLRNGHTSFWDEELGHQAGSIPFRIRRINGRWTVVRSRIAELHPGDVVTEVDGKPVNAWLEAVREHIGQSSLAALDWMTWLRPFLLPRHFTIGTDDGRQVPIDLTVPPIEPERGPPLAAEVEIIHRPDGLVVIRIPGFDDPKYEDAAISAVQGVENARAILLDLRDNNGGSSPGGLLSAIMTNPYRGTLVSTPMTIAKSDASNSFNGSTPALPTTMMRSGPDITLPFPDAWQGKMALLINGGSASACEDFALRFKDGDRGLVLGEPSFGSTGQPYFVRFPGFGMSFRVSTKREYFPDGRQFEGVGVRPDKSIPLTRDELRSGIDTQLEVAAKAILAD